MSQPVLNKPQNGRNNIINLFTYDFPNYYGPARLPKNLTQVARQVLPDVQLSDMSTLSFKARIRTDVINFSHVAFQNPDNYNPGVINNGFVGVLYKITSWRNLNGGNIEITCEFDEYVNIYFLKFSGIQTASKGTGKPVLSANYTLVQNYINLNSFPTGDSSQYLFIKVQNTWDRIGSRSYDTGARRNSFTNIPDSSQNKKGGQLWINSSTSMILFKEVANSSITSMFKKFIDSVNYYDDSYNVVDAWLSSAAIPSTATQNLFGETWSVEYGQPLRLDITTYDLNNTGQADLPYYFGGKFGLRLGENVVETTFENALNDLVNSSMASDGGKLVVHTYYIPATSSGSNGEIALFVGKNLVNNLLLGQKTYPITKVGSIPVEQFPMSLFTDIFYRNIKENKAKMTVQFAETLVGILTTVLANPGVPKTYIQALLDVVTAGATMAARITDEQAQKVGSEGSDGGLTSTSLNLQRFYSTIPRTFDYSKTISTMEMSSNENQTYNKVENVGISDSIFTIAQGVSQDHFVKGNFTIDDPTSWISDIRVVSMYNTFSFQMKEKIVNALAGGLTFYA